MRTTEIDLAFQLLLTIQKAASRGLTSQGRLLARRTIHDLRLHLSESGSMNYDIAGLAIEIEDKLDFEP